MLSRHELDIFLRLLVAVRSHDVLKVAVFCDGPGLLKRVQTLLRNSQVLSTSRSYLLRLKKLVLLNINKIVT